LKNLLLIHSHAAGAAVKLVHYRNFQRPECMAKFPAWNPEQLKKMWDYCKSPPEAGKAVEV